MCRDKRREVAPRLPCSLAVSFTPAHVRLHAKKLLRRAQTLIEYHQLELKVGTVPIIFYAHVNISKVQYIKYFYRRNQLVDFTIMAET